MRRKAEATELAQVARDEVRRHWTRLLGMGLYWAWLQVVFSSFIHAPGTPLGDNDPTMRQLVWLFSLGFTLATFAAAILLRKHLPTSRDDSRNDGSRQVDARKVGTRWSGILSHAFMAVGTLLLVVGGQLAGDGQAVTGNSFDSPLGDPQTLVVVCGAVLTGVGSGVAFLLWGGHLATLSTQRVMFDMTAYAIQTALFTCVFFLLPNTVAGVCAIVLPCVAGVLLARSCASSEQTEPATPVPSELAGPAPTASPTPSPAPDARNPQTARLVVLAVFVGLVFGLMRGLTASTSEATTLATVVGIAISAVLLAVTAFACRRPSELYLTCQVSFPLLALGFLLLHVVKGETLPVIVFMAGHNYFYSLLWVFCAERAHARPGAAAPVFAGGLLAFLGSSFAGSLVGMVLNGSGVRSGQEIGAVSLVVLYLFIVALAYLLGITRRNAEEEMSRRAQSFKLATAAIAQASGLSPREEEVFHLIALGKDRAEICAILGIASDTVKAHTRHVYAKLGIHSKKDAAELVARYPEDSSI